MDWIKIKTNHILNTSLTLLEIGALVKLQVLTAHLERVPTQKEVNATLPHRVCTTLATKLQDQRMTLARVLDKVCEDIAEVVGSRRKALAKMKKWRKKRKNTHPVTVTDTVALPSSKAKQSKAVTKQSNNNKEGGELVPYGTPTQLEVNILSLWNTTADQNKLPQVKALTKERKRKLAERLSNKDFSANLEAALAKIPHSDFLLGKNDRGWRVNFDFLIANDLNVVKMLEGRYDNQPAADKSHRTHDAVNRLIEKVEGQANDF